MAWLADQAEHGGECGQHPIGLLAIIRALQGPGRGQHRGLRGDFRGQRADGLGGDGGDGRGPFRGFRQAITFAGDVGAQLVPANAMRGEEFLILSPARQDFMRHGQQQRGIRAGADGRPFRAGPIRHIRPSRRYLDEAQPGFSGGAQIHLIAMLVRTTRGDIAIPDRQPAQAEHDLGIARNRRPIRDFAKQHFIRAQDMRQQRLRRRIGIGIHLARIAATKPEEALQLAARMMEPPSRGPAIGTAHDGFRPCFGTHTAGFFRDQPHRLVPGYRHKGIAPAQSPTPAAFQPALAHIGAVYPRRAMHRIGHRLDQGTGERVAVKGLHAHQPAIFHHRIEAAPMGRMGFDFGHETPPLG